MWFVLLFFMVQHSYWLTSTFCNLVEQLDPEYVPEILRGMTDFWHQLHYQFHDLTHDMDRKMHVEIDRLNILLQKAKP